MQICSINSSIAPLHASFVHQNSLTLHHFPSLVGLSTQNSQLRIHRSIKRYSIQCSVEETKPVSLRTCKQCKTQFDPSLNHPQACRFHTAHFGGNQSVFLFFDTINNWSVLSFLMFYIWRCHFSCKLYMLKLERDEICSC